MKRGQKIVPFMVLCAVMTLLLLVFSITTILGIRNMDLAIRQEEQAYQSNTKKLAELQSIVEHEEEYRQAIAVMKQLIPDQVNDTVVLNQISTLCKTTGVDLIEVGFGDRVVTNDIHVLPLKLKLRGGYFPYMDLIKKMTYGERLFRIDEMNINQDSVSSGLLNVELSVRMFYN